MRRSRRSLIASLLFVASIAGPARAQPAPQQPAPAAAPAPADDEPIRDPIGDMNAELVRAGEFPGAIVIPNTGNVSFGVIGMVKALGIHDSKAEGRRAIFFAGMLGEMGRDDVDGGTALTAELTRLAFDARAPVADGRVRGYVAFDFIGGGFNWRQGFLSWRGPWGEILAGKTWTTFMDTRAVGETVSEPYVSGGVYALQSMFRYTRQWTPRLTMQVAVEDPLSNDVLAPAPVLLRTGWPDLIATLSYGTSKAHVQVGSLLRSIEYDPNDEPGASDLGRGITVSGSTYIGRDWFTAVFATGRGLGRYLTGLTPSSAAFIGLDPPVVHARRNTGGYFIYRHIWNGTCKSLGSWGYASAETIDEQGPGALSNSSMLMTNLLCRANRFTTIGVEYNYGRRVNRDTSVLDSHRVMVGMQLF